MAENKPKGKCPCCGQVRGTNKQGLMNIHRAAAKFNHQVSAGDNFYAKGLMRTQCRGVGQPAVKE